MLSLGLTGSIATGKSTTLEAFRGLGIPVFSADAAVSELYAGDAVAPVAALFPGVVRDGAIDRVELSRQLLAAPEKLASLEATVHPLVRQRIAAFLAQSRQSGAPLAVVEIPLLFETGFDYGLDRIAVTVCSPESQRRRALARPGMTVEKLEAILARQLPQDEKRKRADYVLDTDLPVQTLVIMVEALVGELVAGETSS
ncbi:MAG TPA: dephospho-CoA kinase [Devosiaceae bacterium]|jgi:dephospho-CoA kinase